MSDPAVPSPLASVLTGNAGRSPSSGFFSGERQIWKTESQEMLCLCLFIPIPQTVVLLKPGWEFASPGESY